MYNSGGGDWCDVGGSGVVCEVRSGVMCEVSGVMCEVSGVV